MLFRSSDGEGQALADIEEPQSPFDIGEDQKCLVRACGSHDHIDRSGISVPLAVADEISSGDVAVDNVAGIVLNTSTQLRERTGDTMQILGFPLNKKINILGQVLDNTVQHARHAPNRDEPDVAPTHHLCDSAKVERRNAFDQDAACWARILSAR